MKPEILFLSHRIPYPPNKGDKIRSWRLLQHLAQRFSVHLCCFVDDPMDFAHRGFLEGVCETVTLVPLSPILARVKSLSGLAAGSPLSFNYFQDSRMTRAVRIARSRPLVAEVAFSSSMAPYIEEPVAGRKRIVDFCDSDSEKFRQYAQESVGPKRLIYQREAEKLARAETNIANWADASFAVTAQEATLFNARFGSVRPVDWFVNGVDVIEFDPSQIKHDSNCTADCVFVGAMDYRANVEGVLKFVENVWPKVRKSSPDARFAIVGSNPVPKIARLHNQNGINVTGRVADIRPWLLGAKIVVAPLLVARGIQNKVLEAMAMAKPIVASSGAMTGIGAPDSAAIVADTPEAVAKQICALLPDQVLREAMGQNARVFVQSQFSWESGLVRFGQTLERLGLYDPAASTSSSPSNSVTN